MGFKSFDDTACRKARQQELPQRSSGGFDLDSGAEIKSPCCKIIICTRSREGFDLDSGAEIKSPCCKIIICTRSRDDEPVSVGNRGDPAGLCVVSLWLDSILQLVSALAKRNRSDDFA